MDNKMIEAIIVVILIVIYEITLARKKLKRKDVIANYRTAERFGRHRLLYSEETGILFESDIYRIRNWDSDLIVGGERLL